MKGQVLKAKKPSQPKLKIVRPVEEEEPRHGRHRLLKDSGWFESELAVGHHLEPRTPDSES